ncbi:MAG: hypothetical protein FWF46_01760 [Oscillospiraceae bacterium]|nr:hypothetical protein [Oscillospiraceae bacterium]
MEVNKRNSKKIIKKYLVLVTFILTLVAIYEITSVYALFHSQATANVSESLARWKILVNNQDIVSGTEQSFDMGDFVVPNASVMGGKFAPGLEGYFELTIEPQDTQVSVRYDITIDQSSAILQNIHLISVEEIMANNTLIQTAEDTYTGIIPVSDIKDDYVNTIKITFKWDDTGDKDAVNTPIVEIPIKVKVTQYLGEAITGI